MITLEAKDIKLNAVATDKINAIILAGSLLNENGYTEKAYTESMLKREKEASTYIGNGIAIPHGSLADKDYIKKTGVVFLQFKNGVQWDDANIAYIVIGIAAKNDEHISILANITNIVQNKYIAELLRTTDDVNVVIEQLSYDPIEQKNAVTINVDEFPIKLEITIKDKHGLHARPATNLINKIKGLKGEVYIEHKGKIANARNLFSLLSLGVEKDNLIKVYVKGTDADKIAEAIKLFIENPVEEEESNQLAKNLLLDEYNYKSKNIINGISVNRGIAIGVTYIHQLEETKSVKSAGTPIEEWKKLKNALIQAREELISIKKNLIKMTGNTLAKIIDTQISIIEDESVIKEINTLIREGRSAFVAWTTVIDGYINSLNKIGSKYIAERRLDIEDLKNRVIKLLTDEKDRIFNIHEPSILIADELFPTDIQYLNKNVIGIALSKGSENSHVSILINALDIPMIVSCGDEVLQVTNNTQAILDSIKGCLVVNPIEDDVKLAELIQKRVKEQKEKEQFLAFEPAITIDKKRVEVKANVANGENVITAIDKGAEGIGLLRTEFLYMNRLAAPTFEEQYNIYSSIAEQLRGLPLTIRLLDVGGDKKIDYIKEETETNPFLGIRGIRLLLEYRDILTDQINAIVKTALNYNVNLLIPMVTFYEELEAVLEIINEAKKTYNIKELKVGIMVEVPAVAILADIMVEKVDFFSIGTNDLTQYTLAVDRTHPKLVKQADHLHPSVLRLIKNTIESAHSAGKEVAICGEIASDIQAVPFLIGLGADELSVNLHAIATIKSRIRDLNSLDCKDITSLALKCKTAKEVRELYNKFINYE
jgi:phosphocarrier protein FPr